MKIADFDFELPPRFIAARPAEPRDSARLLEVSPAGLADHVMRDLPGLLRPGDLLVFNDTRVIPARLLGWRGAARVELTLIRSETPERWRAFAKPARRLKAGDKIVFTPDGEPEFAAEVLARGEGGEVRLRFDRGGPALRAALEKYGAMPLPPYIKRPKGRDSGADPRDARDYQTVYARHEGAVAAPTAGLHFTEALLAALAQRGIGQAFVTLHVGPGTFLPVKADRVEDHLMHAETGIIAAGAAEAVNRARAAGGRIVAVGTTSLRLLETAARADGAIEPFAGDTALYILPGFHFRAVDMLLTNFHLPRSTLFMLAAAFAGLTRMHEAYAHAKAHDYRFYSYGDACLLHRGDD